MALDQYLLRGVRHNIPFVRDVLRNDDFVKGYTPTGFIGEHYPDGFVGGVGTMLSEVERKELAVIAWEIYRRREMAMDNPPLALMSRDGGHHSAAPEGEEDEEVVVCLGGMFGDAYLVRSSLVDDYEKIISSSVAKLPKNSDGGGNDEKDEDDAPQVVNLSQLEYKPSSDLAQVKVAGESRAVQVSAIWLVLPKCC
jgi:propionyl-CoA carboxylase alpha chain